MTEEGKFQRKFIQKLEEVGCYVVKFNASGVSKVGVPDVLTCMKGLFVAWEIKKENGVISDIQQWNINQIRKSGGYAFCIKPSNYDEVLASLLSFGNALQHIERLCKSNEKKITDITV